MTEISDRFYTDAVPAFLEPYLASEAMGRLQNVDMNCGMGSTSFPLFKDIQPYSRYIHSLHTALCAWHFTYDQVISLACLFHDIATPAFAHTVDFANGDYMKQESTEEMTEEILAEDPVISAQLRKDGISLKAVSDYHRYPIADNASPRLSCDRLEYTIGNASNYRFADEKSLHEIYGDIHVGTNEDGESELVFDTASYGEALGLLSVRCGQVYASCNDRYGMERLAEILNQAVKKKILAGGDLMQEEPHVIHLLEESSLHKDWEAFTKLSSLTISDHPGEGALRLQVKKRYIDPYVKGKGRVSSFAKEYRKELQKFLDDPQKEWMKGNTI